MKTLQKQYEVFDIELTKEEAEKALQEYLKNEGIRARKKIDEEHRMAKEYLS